MSSSKEMQQGMYTISAFNYILTPYYFQSSLRVLRGKRLYISPSFVYSRNFAKKAHGKAYIPLSIIINLNLGYIVLSNFN